MRKYTQTAFTLVELMITIVVMVILLGLGTVSVTGLQAQARDKERVQDVQAIARGLEESYKKSNPIVTSTTPSGMIQRGAYPGIREILHATGTAVNGSGNNHYEPFYTPNQVSDGYITKLLPGTTKETFKSPGENSALGVVCVWDCQAAENTVKIQEAFGNAGGVPGAYKDKYVYEPVGVMNYMCWDRNEYNSIYFPNSPCVKFNLYWISETDKTPYLNIPGLKVLKSKHK